MRWLLTLLRIVCIAAAALLLAVTALFSIALEPGRSVYFWSGATWSRFALWMANVTVEVAGLKEEYRTGNYIVVSNHASMFDIPALMTTFPKMRIMFKKELSYVPIWGWAMRWGDHIMVDRKKGTEAMKSLDRAARAIATGGQVLLFAEGTRTRDGKLQAFKRGAFSLAARSGVPILPVTINGSFTILPKGSFDIRPSAIRMVIGEPVPTTGIDSREKEMKLMAEVRGVIERAYREPEA
jgi:1-acyl-sn-glycerol-3-phosphate acyltransferase